MNWIVAALTFSNAKDSKRFAAAIGTRRAI
jgi:hypothetical protein